MRVVTNVLKRHSIFGWRPRNVTRYYYFFTQKIITVENIPCVALRSSSLDTDGSADTTVHVADGHFTHDRRRGPTAIATRAAVVAFANDVATADAYPSGYTYTRTHNETE